MLYCFLMSKPALSGEEIYCTLETLIVTISQHVPIGDIVTSSFPDQQITEQLKQHGYNQKTSWAFLRACYWHLADRGTMVVDPSNRYHFTERITEDKKEKICMEIYYGYETYLQANYARSLVNPTPYYVPEKDPDSFPGFKRRLYFSGWK